MTKKHQVSLFATDEEYALLLRIKEKYKRSKLSDTIRFLILREGENFLPANISKEINPPGQQQL